MCDLNIICCIVSHKLLNMLINSPEVKYISFDSEVFLCGNKLYSEIEKPNYKTMTYNTNLTGKKHTHRYNRFRNLSIKYFY